MATRAERGMSAPPEVVFNTAIDPHRVDAWLPEPLRNDGRRRPDDRAEADLRARWTSSSHPDWSAELSVRPQNAGGAWVRLEIGADLDEQRLAALADESLANLAEEVAENLTAG